MSKGIQTRQGLPPSERPITARYLSTTQLARRWSVSAVTVIRLIEQGDLRGLRIRRSYRISRDSVEEFEARASF